jgi:hypothetical protein
MEVPFEWPKALKEYSPTKTKNIRKCYNVNSLSD